MRKLFGTDGIRGVANTYPITAEMALRIGRAVACIFKEGSRKHKILIGRDTRLSGPMIESALTAGICSTGVDVILAGILPTPAISRLTLNYGCDSGIMISASHNPYQDNGIKIFSSSGLKLPDKTEEEVEELICCEAPERCPVSPDQIGEVSNSSDSEDLYMQSVMKSIAPISSLKGLKIVLDCANGAAFRVAPLIFRKLEANVICLAASPDGKNINHNCGAMHTEMMAAQVLEHRADLGIALDGDADRVIMADEEGKRIDGDNIMAICAAQLKAEGLLKKNTVVATVMSNIGFLTVMKEMGINVVRTQVGDRYILEEMLSNGFNFGGEQSGHLIFLEHSTTGDGILSALQVMSIMKKKNKRLSELNIMTTFPQCIINVNVRERVDLETIPEINSAILEEESHLGEKGRILVRYSGTQLMCRIMVEGPSDDEIKRIANRLAGLIQRRLN
jgi:phosphoglucosamine mutase